MQNLTVPVVADTKFGLPGYTTAQSAGMDVRADIDAPMTVNPMQRVLVPTGLRVALPPGFEMQLRPRSGLALKHGLTLANTPGTIDADYRGQISVIIINLGSEPFVIQPGERICQAVVTQYARVQWQPVQSLDQTDRGEGGFGHTGTK